VAADPNADGFLKLADSLRELELVIGPKARPAIGELRARLAEAAALRSNGAIGDAVAKIRDAMERMARLAGELDPAEAMLMRMVSDRFSAALAMGDKSAVKQAVNVMRHKAGDPGDEPGNDW
jgi:hypothetical protein